MNTRLAIARATLCITTLCITTLCMTVTSAHADEGDDPLSRVAITYDYAHRTTTGVQTKDAFSRPLDETRTSTQSIHAVGFHALLWSPQNGTLQGHLPALQGDAQIGYVTQDDEQSPGEDTGGGLGGIKVTTPWSLVDLGWLRVGAGFGFGIVYEFGTADPDVNEWHGIDFDLAFNLTAEAMLGGITVRGAYDNAFYGIMYDSQHRARVFVDWSWLTLGAEYRVTDMGRGAEYTQIGAMAGISVY